uniref:FLYWCH-type domain-containing protein n=1 Tax=Anopheles atroparvus TaxID=41427 RepID=A0A182IYC6_ANOAO
MYITNDKGNRQLWIEGFPFMKHMIKNGTVYWRCVQFRALRCAARYRQRQATGMLEIVHTDHNHALIQQRHIGVMEIKYVRSKRGAPQLKINGQTYCRQMIRERTIRWRCVQFKPLHCMARATTSPLNGDNVISLTDIHNHPIINERRKHGELKRLLERRRMERMDRLPTFSPTDLE